MKKGPEYICAACGWRHLREPQRSSSGGASNEICPSCGFEPGFTDDEQGFSFEQWRLKWVQSGMQWFSKGVERPADWNAIVMLQGLLNRKRPVIPPIRLRKAAELRNNKDSTPPSAGPKSKKKR